MDLTHVFEEWPYDPEDNIRVIAAEDGRYVLQSRQPLGIEQYELDGRPDGQHPDGGDTIVSTIEARLAEHQLSHGTENGFALDHEECVQMQAEGILFYYRYLLLFQLNDYERVIHDTDHNLRICHLLENFCEDEEDRDAVLQFKPYIYRMHAVSKAMLLVQQHDRPAAREEIRRGIKVIQAMSAVDSPAFQFEKVRSVNYLRKTLEEIGDTAPDPVFKLQEELEEAVESEDYERAARLRDHIRELS